MLERWNTPVSDVHGLRFMAVEDTGEGRVLLADADQSQFELLLDAWCGPYVVVGEEYLTEYWNVKEKHVGWTFMVASESSRLLRCYPEASSAEGFSHYVVSTEDTCIELLARMPPPIRRLL